MRKLHRQEYEEALEHFDRALKKKPQYAKAYAARGITHFKQSHDYKAISDLTKAIELGVRDPEVFYHRGLASSQSLWMRKGGFERAIEDLTSAMALGMDGPEIHRDRGAAYDLLDKPELVIRDVTKAITLDPTKGYYYFERATAYFDVGKYENAIADFTKAIDLTESDAGFYRWRSWSNMAAGHYRAAAKDAERHLTLSKWESSTWESSFIVAYYGYCYGGRSEKAKALLAQVAKQRRQYLQPSFVRFLLKKITPQELLNRVRGDKSNSIRWNCWLGYHYALAGEKQEALACLQFVIQSENKSRYYHFAKTLSHRLESDISGTKPQ